VATPEMEMFAATVNAAGDPLANAVALPDYIQGG
jgi:hypothetical protein